MYKVNNKDIVIYHKQCMDGIASAAVYYMYNPEAVFIPVQHGTVEAKDIITTIENVIGEKLTKEHKVLFLDFSIDVKQLIDISKLVSDLIIIDHHKTFIEGSKQLGDYKNINIIFDINESGATLTWDYVFNTLDYPYIYDRTYAEYVKDRDIWIWKMPYSKEFNNGLRDFVFDLNSGDTYITKFIDATNMSTVTFIDKGDEIGRCVNKIVKGNIATNKLSLVTLRSKDYIFTNVTNEISETGNVLCLKYNLPSLTYFILANGDVIFSLRSTDELGDISELAKYYKGGGHSNAAGFTKDLNFLQELYLKAKPVN